MLDPSKLEPFVDPLTIPSPQQGAGTHANPQNTAERLPYYRIDLREAQVNLYAFEFIGLIYQNAEARIRVSPYMDYER